MVVVSGGALGIDSAAHGGALGVAGGAAAVAVLGTALDAPTTALAIGVARRPRDRHGAVLSEIPPGVHSARWWFAVRNRVIAALAHVVVVVECHHRGGSLNTVAAALARGVAVTAVPGSVRSPASAGTNRLLVEGAAPVRDVDDVLTAVELAVVAHSRHHPSQAAPGRRRATTGSRRTPPLGARAGRVRRALDQDPATLDEVVRRSGLVLGEVSLALEELSDAGLAVGEKGWWSRPGNDPSVIETNAVLVVVLDSCSDQGRHGDGPGEAQVGCRIGACGGSPRPGPRDFGRRRRGSRVGRRGAKASRRSAGPSIRIGANWLLIALGG